MFYKKIDEDWIKKHIHRDDCMMTYLGRGNHYSECGFLYFNLKHKDTIAYANRMKSLYDTDGIYNLKEQHDSYVWDYVRKEFENRGTKIIILVMVNRVMYKQVYIRCCLRPHQRPRKLKGRSPRQEYDRCFYRL